MQTPSLLHLSQPLPPQGQLLAQQVQQPVVIGGVRVRDGHQGGEPGDLAAQGVGFVRPCRKTATDAVAGL